MANTDFFLSIIRMGSTVAHPAELMPVMRTGLLSSFSFQAVSLLAILAVSSLHLF